MTLEMAHNMSFEILVYMDDKMPDYRNSKVNAYPF